jgi:hypothetical protein
MVNFPFEFIILKIFIAETHPFSRKLLGKRKFSRKFHSAESKQQVSTFVAAVKAATV